MSTATFLNNAGAFSVIPLNILANLNRIDSSSSTEIIFGSVFVANYSLRAIGTGITTDGDGNITGGTITALEFPVDGQVQMRLTNFGSLSAIDAAAAFTGGSLPGYDQMISLLNDNTCVTGSTANDWIDTGGGNDTVNAGLGDDRVSKFKAGNLVYNGGDGSDTLNFGAENGVIYPTPFITQLIIDLSAGTAQSPYGGTFTLTSVENVIGTSQADSITGSDADNRIGDGIFDRGADTITCLGGNDTVKMNIRESGVLADGGTGSDTVFVDTAGGVSGINVFDLQNNGANTGVFARNSFIGFENVTFFQNTPTIRLDFRGNAATNTAIGGLGRDLLDGRAGDDFLFGNEGADTLTGGTGNDFMQGGNGNDVYFVDSSLDNVSEFAFGGVDEARASTTYTLPFEVERLTLLGGANVAGTGNSLNNIIAGNAGRNVLIGDFGADRITGGGGVDTFRYMFLSDSGLTGASRDVIVDFATGDRIDVRLIDANEALSGNQAFVVDTNGDFAAGEIRIAITATGALISFNTNASAGAEMSIFVAGVTGLSAADFLL